MKNRYGFVSNSSASSFIVRYKDRANQDGTITEFLISEEVGLLEQNGWRITNSIRSDFIEYENVIDEGYYVNFGKGVNVNQDDVIFFLLENNISFTGTCHYGDETVVFNKDSKCFYKFYNIGNMNELDMNCRDKDPEDVIRENEYDDWYKKINVQEWLSKNQWLKNDE